MPNVIENIDRGHLHPVSQVINQIVSAFQKQGFVVAEGPEIEDDFHNFTALNVPPDHPSRDMQDTTWLKGLKHLMRTQTSAVQVRYMEKLIAGEPPFRIIVPGKVYRHEATDARHESQFYQVEGLLVEEKVTVAQLKGYLDLMFQSVFGPNVKTRLRPSFFPFVEPGFEVDMLCFKCQSKKDSCSLCGGGGWLELGGAGLVHPKVFESVGVDPNKWQGFAFGLGPERITMIKYQIDDIRLFSSGDLRFLNQF